MRGGFQIGANLRNAFRRQQFAILQPFTQAQQTLAKPFGGFRCDSAQILKQGIGEMAQFQIGNQASENSEGIFGMGGFGN